jgi:hypothetical protein
MASLTPGGKFLELLCRGLVSLVMASDIIYALDNNACVILLMLDLSAAFDVIDHDILFDRLQYSFVISGSALSWIRSEQCCFS